ncbi:DUF4238 domain-containing protein [Tardiphaga sp. OK245]|uniref:DUF4238 domain-containing protein n=1 Tax=Tardiphaga sp. OK245 TaxID=1855306 RepID=UPI0008A7D335|nr:DUF4238 domain-containing protein [Tardiphaga sp. OK245]SEH40356.1 Protein of unknown function [Tardiphaga sp. OK245]
MALDHYVSQVHLKNFYSPALGERLYAMRKSTLKAFTPRAQDICRIAEGSTNRFLDDPRTIEDFLRDVEPAYNLAVSRLREGKPDPQAVYAIAGFVAYVTSCAPAAMRIHAAPLRGALENTAALLEGRGDLPAAPPELGGKSLTELLADGTVQLEIDEKYPQALGINSILQRVSIFGNSPWEVMHNTTDSPFFTSDYPVALEASGRPGLVNWIVPLAPDLAVRIRPDVRLSRAPVDLTFPRFSCEGRPVSRSEVMQVNRLIVRSAEDCVFYRDQHGWVAAFIEKNRAYRIESVVSRIPTGRSFFTSASQMIVSVPVRTA